MLIRFSLFFAACISATTSLASESVSEFTNCDLDFSESNNALSSAQSDVFAGYLGNEMLLRYKDAHTKWKLVAQSIPENCSEDASVHAAYRRLRSIAIQSDSTDILVDLERMWSYLSPTYQAEEAEYHHRTLIMHRNFSAAEKMRERFPYISKPMHILSCMDCEDVRSRLIPKSGNLLRQPIDMSKHTGLLVVGHPGCAFTQAMWQGIKDDLTLFDALRDEAIWIAVSWTDLTPDAFSHYSAQVPDMPFNPVWKQSEWPEIDSWNSPSVYAYRDGEVVGRHIGWPRGKADATRAKLRALLALTRD